MLSVKLISYDYTHPIPVTNGDIRSINFYFLFTWGCVSSLSPAGRHLFLRPEDSEISWLPTGTTNTFIQCLLQSQAPFIPTCLLMEYAICE